MFCRRITQQVRFLLNHLISKYNMKCFVHLLILITITNYRGRLVVLSETKILFMKVQFWVLYFILH